MQGGKPLHKTKHGSVVYSPDAYFVVSGTLSYLFVSHKRFIKRSLATLDNYDEWKERRRVFNPAFTQRFDSILQKIEIFIF